MRLINLSDALQLASWDLSGATVPDHLLPTRSAVIGVAQDIRPVLKQWEQGECGSDVAACASGSEDPAKILEAAE